MPTDFSSDTLHGSDEPNKNDKTWSDIAQTVASRPGMKELGDWIEASLDKLEHDYSEFTTKQSMRRNFGR